MRRATAARASVRSFSARANGSTTKLSWNKLVVPSPLATKIPASARMMIASHKMSSPRSRLVATPSISRTMEPPTRMISGNATSRWSARSICGLLWQQRKPRVIGRGKACMVALGPRMERHSRCIEDRRWVEAEKDGEQDKRRHHRDLAPGKISDVSETCLLKLAENDAAVEPKRIRGRQDDSGGGEECDPGVDAEGAGQAQEFADKAAGAR